MEVMHPVNFLQLQEQINGLSREYISYNRTIENCDYVFYKAANGTPHNEEEETANLAPTVENRSSSLVVWGCGEFGQHGLNQTGDVAFEVALGKMMCGQSMLPNHEFPINTVCGSSHTLVLTGKGRIYSWGNGTSGQLGNGTCVTSCIPTLVSQMSDKKIQGLACGARHSFIWTNDGDCYSFGNNFNAQLGYNFSKADFKENQLEPVLVELFPDMKVKEVACGARHSLFLLTTGRVMAVGSNQHGQVGNETTEDVVIPAKLENLNSITRVACGNIHSLASDENGAVYAWGYGKAFGNKTSHVVTPHRFIPPKAAESSAVASLAGGDCHSMVLYNNGVLLTWGNNYEGQLGVGKDVKYRSEPEGIPRDLLPRPVVQMACGEATSAAITDKGELFMWGKNVGLIHSDKPSQFFQYTPHHIPMGSQSVTQVSCGAWHVSAIVKNTTNEGELFEKLDTGQAETGEVIDINEPDLISEKGVKLLPYEEDTACVTERQIVRSWSSTCVRRDEDESLLGATCPGSDPEGSRAANGGHDVSSVATEDKLSTVYSEEISLEEIHCTGHSARKLDTSDLCKREFHESAAVCSAEETNSTNDREAVVDDYCEKQPENSGSLRKDENEFQTWKNSCATSSVGKKLCKNLDPTTGSPQTESLVTSFSEFETEGKMFLGKDKRSTNNKLLRNVKNTIFSTLKPQKVCSTEFEKEKTITLEKNRRKNVDYLLDKSEDFVNESDSEDDFLAHDDSNAKVDINETKEASENNGENLTCTNHLKQWNNLQSLQDFHHTESTHLSEKKPSKETYISENTPTLSVHAIEHISSMNKGRNPKTQLAVTPEHITASNPKHVFSRQQTMPVIDLSFGKTFGTNVSGRRETDLYSRTKTNFTTFTNVWKASSLFREKQRQKKLRNGGSDKNLVFNLECMLPNRPAHTVKEIEKWTKVKENHSTQETKSDNLAKNDCCHHSGGILPPICSCKKNNLQLRKRDSLTNVFIDRR